MTISSIVGHTLQLQALTEDIARGNVVHAYLFTGPRHLGKFTVAKWFAKELLTTGITNEEEKKAAIDSINRLLHPDYLQLDQLWMEEVCEDFSVIAETSNIPQQHRMKAKAKTDSISIEDIRVLQEKLADVGTGKYRCCLIRSVERMQGEAANALLKILEEPPQGVTFLLTSEVPASLLPTLRSRTRIVRFSRLSAADLQPLVQGIPEEEAQFLLRRSQGAPGTLLRLRDDSDAFLRERTLSTKTAEFWRSHSLVDRLQILKPLHERGEEADRLLLHLALALREESPPNLPQCSSALSALIAGFETNAQRKLLTQRFAMAVS